ncbi:hypothetical protein [Thalassovita taeanensis]|uniref:Uncharacterized protein n=1 Tax=Thalassovita taeanensis TaxID=657014 RepID=A0A1H9JS52_9RHOB|nr:hypothetical protein [Thalassovita taeanensis]SEQ89642.1 hypothetical protein SAMN04488092_1165 [Thalassovita taeanensis]
MSDLMRKARTNRLIALRALAARDRNIFSEQYQNRPGRPPMPALQARSGPR